MLSSGITSYTEAAVGFVRGRGPELRRLCRALADAGLIKQRATLCITWTPGTSRAERAIRLRNLSAGPRVSPELREDLPRRRADRQPHGRDARALCRGRRGASGRGGAHRACCWSGRSSGRGVTRFDRMGLTVKFHAAGDAAVGRGSMRSPRRARRMASAGRCTTSGTAPSWTRGPRRARGHSAPRSRSHLSLESRRRSMTASSRPSARSDRARVAGARDAGRGCAGRAGLRLVRGPSVSPWIGMETLVTRERPGGSKDSFGKAEAISVGEALDLFTSTRPVRSGSQTCSDRSRRA